MFFNYENISIVILFISFSTHSQVLGIKKQRNSAGSHTKNEVLNLLKIRRMCMDVCNPPYFAQEYPASYGNPYGQYYPSGSYGYGNNDQPQNYPFGSYNYGNNGQFQNFPFGTYGYGSYYDTQSNIPASFGYGGSLNYPSGSNAYEYNNGIQNYYPQNQFGEYYPWCYRDMFRKKYNIDPGTRMPRVFHYKRRILKKKVSYKMKRNNNFNQDYINCQRICYPLVIPETISTKSTAKVTKSKITIKMTRTTTVSSTTKDTPDGDETTISPSGKPNDSTMAKPSGNTISTDDMSAADVEFQSTNIQPSGSTFETFSSDFVATQKPRGGAKSKRKDNLMKYSRMVPE